MNDGQRLSFLILILAVVVSFTTGVTNYLLYDTAFEEARKRLIVIAKSQARLMEAVAGFNEQNNADYPDGAAAATLRQITEAHHNFKLFGETGEFILARLEGEQIVFLLERRFQRPDQPPPAGLGSYLAEPMRQALLGHAGTLEGLDYRGELVLAAYEPVDVLDIGVVTKIDLSEIRAPFIETGIISGIVALLAIIAGAFLFIRTTNPMLRRIHDSEAKYRDLAETSQDLIWRMDRLGRFTYQNPAWAATIGYSLEEMLGRKFTEFKPAEEGERSMRENQRVLQGGSATNYETIYIAKSGGEITLHVKSKRLMDDAGRIVGTQGTATDITELKQAEAELSRHRDQLEELVKERTKELREAQEQLIRREKLALLGQLAGGVGHELRNPLGAIKNAVYFLNMALENIEPDVEESLRILNEEVTASEKIIGSLLDFARPKDPIRQKVDLRAVVLRIVDKMDVPENIELATRLEENMPLILSDPDQLAQVFGNIILNAIQAMPGGGRLEVKSELPDGGWAAVSITDSGGGIPEENLAKLFEPLFTTKARGIGLGLALTRTLVEGQGGRIEVKSKIGKGSTFTVLLPAGVKEN